MISTDLIAVYVLSTKRLNYQKVHYRKLLTQTMKDADMITDVVLKAGNVFVVGMGVK